MACTIEQIPKLYENDRQTTPKWFLKTSPQDAKPLLATASNYSIIIQFLAISLGGVHEIKLALSHPPLALLVRDISSRIPERDWWVNTKITIEILS